MRLPPRVAVLLAGATLALTTPAIAPAAANGPATGPVAASTSDPASTPGSATTSDAATSDAAAEGGVDRPAARYCPSRLGTAGLYGEFVERDAVRGSRTDGAVAVGGSADLTDGFSIGGRTPPGVRLPGDAALVVGGRLHNGTAGSTEFTVLERGSAVYGSTRGRPPVLKSGSENTEGEPPVDFAAEFGALRALAAELDALPTRGSVTRTTSGGRTTLTLAGDHPGLNVFPVSGGQLADAGRIVVETPPGATVLVNVSGRSHNLRAAGAHGVSGPRGVAASLLWNFAGATTVEGVPGRAWPGTLLAPDAAVHLGPGGPLRGAVLARSLVAEGTEIQHVPFAGCLDPAAFPPRATSTAPGADLATTGGDGQLPALLGGALGALAAGTGLSWAAYRHNRATTPPARRP